MAARVVWDKDPKLVEVKEQGWNVRSLNYQTPDHSISVDQSHKACPTSHHESGLAHQLGYPASSHLAANNHAQW